MRRLLACLFAATLAVGVAPAASAGPGPGYIATDNVEWLATIPLNADSAGARVLDGLLYITDDRGLTIYDLSNPELPTPMGFAPVTQHPYYVEEDVDTNGEILLIGQLGDLAPEVGPLSRVVVLDVSNPHLPTQIGAVEGADEHTITCVLDCSYAYGSGGTIIDLRTPTAPTIAGDWTEATGGHGVDGAHDVTEVAPGIVLTSSNPALLLNLRPDPLHPTVIGRGDFPDNRYVHGNLWPYHGAVSFDDPAWQFDAADFDEFALVGGETTNLGPTCDETAGEFMTLRPSADATGFVTFDFVDDHRVTEALPLDGGSPYDQYCAHWFTPHPTFDDGGLVAMGWYEHGVRFLDVAQETGMIDEVGWFLPLGGSTSAAYWVTDDILLTADYQRGIDVLRFDRETPPGEPILHPGTTFQRAVLPRPAWLLQRNAANPYACPLPT